jgi:hypothetical protein
MRFCCRRYLADAEIHTPPCSMNVEQAAVLADKHGKPRNWFGAALYCGG